MAHVRCYLQVKVAAQRLPRGGWKVEQAKVVGMTQQPPQVATENVFIVECDLEIPDARLLPIEASASVPELRLAAEYEAVMKELSSDD
jgi:hypothetical protein